MAEGGFSEPIRILLTVLRAWLKTLSEYQGAVLAPREVAWWRRTGMRGASYPQSRTYQRQCLALVVLREVMNHWTEVAGGVAIARTCEGRESSRGRVVAPGKMWIVSLRSRLRGSATHAAMDRGCAIGRRSRLVPGIRVPFQSDAVAFLFPTPSMLDTSRLIKA